MSRGAKQMGVVLCDIYVDKDTGKCWPGNEELSRCLAASVRSVQRHVNELIEAGWIQNVRIPRRRRGLQLDFPLSLRHYKHDKTVVNKMPKVSPQHDKTGAPYIKKEPSKNQRRDKRVENIGSNVLVECTRRYAVDTWKRWLKFNTELDVEMVFNLLRIGDAYCLPEAHPINNLDEQNRYYDFFHSVVLSNGECLLQQGPA
ncbi:helix-turn-helix domain-containing protein [Pseudohalocynthiibacter sp. F2068]|uniref:helix-turn-helix domain-containing protein n=1 Tax=Pseudohalocynthiibacter sp. F2068 TaxID=2926418 RepID=UPI001FF107C5|nr:helix-turn-helix domain-containing protein [Pseudohalocynthiibacter sp. F2068]MCK0104414.1 helix-turn-helix domain-containing protein [Pseudohalocynthiibacter sp. F2068]